METASIKYKVRTAGEQAVFEHLIECSDNFFPPLSDRVILQEYSKKISEKAVTFEAWSGNILIGLVAAYTDADMQSAFITNVSVLKKYMGFSIAVALTTRCIEYLKQKKMKEIKLEVHKGNMPAIGLYKKFNFVKYDSKNDIDLMKVEIH